MIQHFADRLAKVVQEKRSALCVGLDPRWESLPTMIRQDLKPNLGYVAAAYEVFCFRVLELVAPYTGVIKPQSAFFEACGPSGMQALQNVLRRCRELGLVTILDAKRGDIASTASAYADAAFGGTMIEQQLLPIWDADALTVNPYLGRDAIEPFLQVARKDGRGLFVLVRTSNPGAGLFQDLRCNGRKLFEIVGDEVQKWSRANMAQCGYGDVGAVVGATHPSELQELRRQLPDVWFLVPGYGAQGGAANDVRLALRSDGLGAIVNSSRGITFPFQPGATDWESKIAAAAKKAAEELRV